MWDKLVALIDALLIHAFMIGIILLGMNIPTRFAETPTHDQTVVIDQRQVQAELNRLTRATRIENAEQQAQQYAIEQKQLEYEQLMTQAQVHLDALRQEQQMEQQQLESLAQRQQEEQALLEKLQQEQTKLSNK